MNGISQTHDASGHHSGEAGIQSTSAENWITAFAGMTQQGNTVSP